MAMVFQRSVSSASLFLVACCLLPVAAQAQAGPELHPWDIFGGVSYVRTLGSNAADNYGWDVSVTERPYARAAWFGGTIEGSGAYSGMVNNAGVNFDNSSLYSFAAGPVVTVPHGRVRPFGRVLLGESWSKFTTELATTDKRSFAYSVGGGVDAGLTRNLAVRVQADWMRSHSSPLLSTDYVRPSAGLVYRF